MRLPEDANAFVDPAIRPDDGQLAASLNQRLKELSVASMDETPEPCTGSESISSRQHHTIHARLVMLRSDSMTGIIAGESLRGLIEVKYGRTYGENSHSFRWCDFCL